MTGNPKGYQLAELNIATLVGDRDSLVVKPFVDATPRINALAERSDGFIWRLVDIPMEDEIRLFGNERTISNLSVWRDFEKFEFFVFQTLHKAFFNRRQEWFLPGKEAQLVMWWVREGHQPSLDEASDRLDALRKNGASDAAFDWGYIKNKAGDWDV